MDNRPEFCETNFGISSIAHCTHTYIHTMWCGLYVRMYVHMYVHMYVFMYVGWLVM